MKTTPLALKASALLALVLLQACGGEPTAGAVRTEADQRPTRLTVVSPLLDDEGRAMTNEPDTEPADPGARTRSQRYATAVQAAHLLDAMGERAVRIEAGCCGADAVETAVSVVNGVRGVYGLDTDAPVLVHGADQRLAATLVNALTDAGNTRVWLVTR